MHATSHKILGKGKISGSKTSNKNTKTSSKKQQL